MDRPNRYLEIPTGPDPSLNKPIDLTPPSLSPVVREALEQAKASIEAATAQAKQQILTAGVEAKKQVEPPSQPSPVTKFKEVESKPVEPPEPKQEQPLWKRIIGGVVNILDYPGRVLTQTALGIADVAKQAWERGHPVEKIVGTPVLAAGAFVVGAMGGIASLISPKAWYETAVALSRPRETISGLKETIAENPFRAAAIAGALAAPVKLPKLAGVGIVERVTLVPERLKAAVVSEAGALAKVEAVWPAKTWKALEAEAELARRGLAKAVRAEPEQMAQLERASKVSEHVMGELSKRTYVKLEQLELPAKYEVAVKDPARLFKNYEAFIEVTGRTEVLGRRLGRIPEGMSFEVKGEGWARALREKFDWGTYERRIYAKDIEQVGFRKIKEFETFEKLAVKSERFEYRARIVDPEAVLEKIPAKPARLRQLDELLRAREIQVVRPIPGPPGITALAHIVKVPQAEAILEKVKPSTPTAPNIIEVSKLRELPVRVDVDANIVEPSVRLGRELFVPGSVPALAHLPRLSRLSETVHRLPSTPALDIVRMEKFSINTISSLRLPSSTDLDAIKPARLQKQIDELLKTSEVPEQPPTPEVVVATPALPRLRDLPIRGDVDVTRHVGPQTPETVLEEIKSTIPTTPKTIELPKLRELSVKAVASGSEGIPALDIVRMERLSINTISSLGLSRTPETVLEPIEARPATVELPKMRELPVRVDVDAKGGAMPEIPSLGQQLVAEGVTLPRLKPGDVVEARHRLGQPDVLKQLPATEVELLKPLVATTLGQVAHIPQASEPRLRTAEILDVDVKTLERIGFDVKQMLPPELAEPGIPALPPAGRAPARTSRTVRQELRLPSLATELRKLKLHRWEWELPEWGKGLRKLLEPSPL
jgi:hypothetical protein